MRANRKHDIPVTSQPAQDDTGASTDGDGEMPDESADESALDELATKPSPQVVNESDVDIAGATMPDEITGIASAGSDDLTALFENTTRRHMTDGFTGSGDEDADEEADELNISQNDDREEPKPPDDGD